MGAKARRSKAHIWGILFPLIPEMVWSRGESLTHGIKSMSFHPFLQHKKRLAELWEEQWHSMKEHQTCTAEIHRKVIRMVTPMSDLEAKLMLRQMGERV
jgi:hypothetical protein